MNLLAIDYGSKRIGLAYSTFGIISTLPVIKNDGNTIKNIQKIVDEFRIEKIYVGVSEGEFGKVTLGFVEELSSMLKLPIETVEESISTIEATEIYKQNRRHQKNFKQEIDSLSAAVVLKRVIG